MNRKEREILDLATGKIRLTEKEIKRREEHSLMQKKEKRDKLLLVASSVLALVLIISGIVWFNARQEAIKIANEGFPSQVPMPSKAEINEMKNEWLVLETTMGDITMELNPDAAPRTARSIRQLVKDGFYDGVIFHRVINDFMIQTGGFTSTEPKDPGFDFRDEINPDALGLSQEAIQENVTAGYKYNSKLPSIKLEHGVLAMANAGPNTNGSQFFIITQKDGTGWLEGKHTGFGKVVQGMEVAEKIQNAPRDEQDKPLEDIIIKTAKLVPKQP
jgi:cyclophilin family peptidyl-prolyl cis-trans isomerase